MSYVVGIDLGTTSTVAAVCRPGGTAQVVPLEGAAGAVPSAVYLGADGTFLVGEAAQRRALSDPGHVVRDLTRRVGDADPGAGRPPAGVARRARRPVPRAAGRRRGPPRGRRRRARGGDAPGSRSGRTGWARCTPRWPSRGSGRRCSCRSRWPRRPGTPPARGSSRARPSGSTTWAAAGATRRCCAASRDGFTIVGVARGRRAVRRYGPRRGGARARPRGARPGVGGARPHRPGGARRGGRPAP